MSFGRNTLAVAVTVGSARTVCGVDFSDGVAAEVIIDCDIAIPVRHGGVGWFGMLCNMPGNGTRERTMALNFSCRLRLARLG